MPPTTSRLQRRRNFFKRLRLYGYASGIFLLAVGIIYLVVGSPVFKIGSLSITGVEASQQESILLALKATVAAGSLGWLGPDNYLAWPEDSSYTTTQVKQVSIKKSLFNRRVTITVVPRDRYAVWCSAAQSSAPCYWVDSDGIIFERAPVAEGQLVQTIFDSATGTAAGIGEPVLPSSSFSVVSKALEGMRSLDIPVAKITVSRALQELWIDTTGGTRLIFSLRFDPSPTALPAVARFVSKPGLRSLEYINLTVENRAFVKYR
jgi:hypothetical protein